MKKRLFAAALAAFVCLICAGRTNGVAALAQNSAAVNAGQSDAQRENEVKRAIQARIDASIEASKKKDLAARLAGLAPDFTGKLKDGQTVTKQDLEEEFKRQHNTVATVSDETRVVIDSIKVDGDEATVFTSQRYVRTTPGGADGKPVEVRTSVTHRETWINQAGGGWVVKRIEELEQGPTFVNGKEVPQDRSGWAFSKIIWEQGVGKAREAFEAARKRDPGAVLFQESTLNALGYRFLAKQRVREAIEIFRLNVEAYPQSSNVYDSLGEAYMADGQNELAIKNYQKSVELNPQNTTGVETLKKLKAP